MNQAQAERAAARAELDNAPVPTALIEAEVYAMIDSLGDVGVALSGADPQGLAKLYDELRLDLRYDAENAIVDETANPRVNSVRVRGRSPAPRRWISENLANATHRHGCCHS